jgi:hypothetical protein
MSPAWHVTLDCTLSMGLPVLWGVRELFLLRRGGWRPGRTEADPRPVPPMDFVPSPQGAGPQDKPVIKLPDSLIPRLPALVRELEDA